MEVIRNDMLLFWRADSIFSNWHEPANFIISGNKFRNSEAAFMFYKALYFSDNNIANQILASTQNPKRMKELGRLVKDFREDSDWACARVEIMYEVCLHKFMQNEKMKQTLLATNFLLLVEASPYDKLWGIGLAPDDPAAGDMMKWRGTNLLGVVLMRVRETIRQKQM